MRRNSHIINIAEYLDFIQNLSPVGILNQDETEVFASGVIGEIIPIIAEMYIPDIYDKMGCREFIKSMRDKMINGEVPENIARGTGMEGHHYNQIRKIAEGRERTLEDLVEYDLDWTPPYDPEKLAVIPQLVEQCVDLCLNKFQNDITTYQAKNRVKWSERVGSARIERAEIDEDGKKLYSGIQPMAEEKSEDFQISQPRHRSTEAIKGILKNIIPSTTLTSPSSPEVSLRRTSSILDDSSGSPEGNSGSGGRG